VTPQLARYTVYANVPFMHAICSWSRRRCVLVASRVRDIISHMTVRVPMLQRHACVSARDSTAPGVIDV
jgi:hypothetical protein